MNIQIERHPLNPFIPSGAKMLLCGTFPPKREKWSMEFFYPNFINDMWRIFGLIVYNDKNYFVDNQQKTFNLDEIKSTLNRLKIAVYDTAKIIHREKDNASDKFLHVIEPLNINELISQIPECKYIVTTGEKASSIVASVTNSPQPRLGKSVQIKIENATNEIISITHYRMPSSSRAYPMKIEKKTEYYKALLIETGIL